MNNVIYEDDNYLIVDHGRYKVQVYCMDWMISGSKASVIKGFNLYFRIYTKSISWTCYRCNKQVPEDVMFKAKLLGVK